MGAVDDNSTNNLRNSKRSKLVQAGKNIETKSNNMTLLKLNLFSKVQDK